MNIKTVGDLIKELEKYDKNLLIYIESTNGEYFPKTINSVKEYPKNILLDERVVIE